jgi:hypothetical protein
MGGNEENPLMHEFLYDLPLNDFRSKEASRKPARMTIEVRAMIVIVFGRTNSCWQMLQALSRWQKLQFSSLLLNLNL